MSLWKVLSKPQIVHQVNTVEMQAGSFVWGKDGFKWTAGNLNKDSSDEGVIQNHWENKVSKKQQESDKTGESSSGVSYRSSGWN